MHYKQVQPGRIFLITVEHGENIITSLEQLAKKEHITAAYLQLLGACKHAQLVIGPKKPVLPPQRETETIKNTASECIGFGTLFLQTGKPIIHLHLALGNKKITKIGHLLHKHEVFIIAEIILVELTHCSATRVWDKQKKLHLVSLNT